MLYSAYRIVLCASPYSQIWLNHKHKAVSGLSFDLVYWSFFTGLLALVNEFLNLFDPLTRKQYGLRHPLSPISAISGWDLLFSMNQIFAWTVCAWQLIKYRPSHTNIQEISVIAYSFSCIALVLIVVIYFAAVYHLPDSELGFYGIKWLDVVDSLAAVSWIADSFRYCPQISVNFMASSTVGFSCRMIWLEMLAQALGLFYLFSGVLRPGRYITRPPSLLFKVLLKSTLFAALLAQHYRLYYGKRNSLPKRSRNFKAKREEDVELESQTLLHDTTLDAEP